MARRIAFLATLLAGWLLNISAAHADCTVWPVEDGACWDFECDTNGLLENGYNCEWGSGGYEAVDFNTSLGTFTTVVEWYEW
jgi:hypothetical protein